MLAIELVKVLQADRERQLRERNRGHAREEHRPRPRINRRDAIG